ncbi:MAG: hypothetical protein ACTS79_04185 [Arsenophonus sp. ET-KM2-MAG3]
MGGNSDDTQHQSHLQPIIQRSPRHRESQIFLNKIIETSLLG